MSSYYRGNGTIQLIVTSADLPAFLAKLSEQGTVLRNIRSMDALSAQLQCSRAELHTIEHLAAKFGANIEIIKEPENVLYTALHRPVLLLTFFLFLCLLTILPTRIYFIQVDGNAIVPATQILEEAEKCGIRFGASRRLVRSEKVKNALLSTLPQLQWAGINTSGCVATISVREKNTNEELTPEVGIGNIIAKTDGIIQTCTVLNGTALCSAGDAVTAGQILVSGYTDCGIALKAVRAEAEITASTIRSVSAVTLLPDVIRGEQIHEETKFSLRIGKKLINLFKDSGISDTSCVKMYTEEYLTLPGGFRLPIALVTQRCIYYAPCDTWDPNWDSWISDACRQYLLSHMQAGQIVMEDTHIRQANGLCGFYGKYVCLENIGQFIDEEIIK
ncbi:MAG: sporulation protein YqfD [Oscillospiraceae bacterium]|nr:sporulation protein YqfD [Oscillospiraceae bacterium]